MSFSFQLLAGAERARRGRMLTPHGAVETPVFMPVGTRASVKAVPQDALEQLGVEILLGNTYHLYLRPGVDTVRKLGGLHRFMSWDRAILTDSGGFQVWSLSELRRLSEEGVEFRSHLDGSLCFLGPETATAAQIALGADIIMAFDECTEHPATRERARRSMELTVRWAARCKRYWEEHREESPVTGRQSPETQGPSTRAPKPGALARDDRSQGTDALAQDEALELAGDWRLATGDWPALFAIVQGGMHPDLRKECARRLVDMDFPGYAIGGLSVGEPRQLTREIVESTLEHLPAGKPRYLMGVGTPEELVEYAGLGVDMMDCVHPTRAARHGLLFTSEGKINIKGARYAEDQGPLDPNCSCPVCARYSRAYLRHLFANGELLGQSLNSIHNLAYYLDTMRRVRQSIHSGEHANTFSGSRSSVKSPAQTQREDPVITPEGDPR
jgi:queuine tRNA-ribosyltransferase